MTSNSKFNTETMTMHRWGKNQQKTNNNSTTRRGAPGTKKGWDDTVEEVNKLFQNRIPQNLLPRPKKGEEEKKEEKKNDTREEGVSSSVNPEQSSTLKKETSYDIGGTSEMDHSDAEIKRRELQRAKQDRDNDQIIYITITETKTAIMFDTPSTKYLTIRNEEKQAEEEKKTELHKQYWNKLKNKESFAAKGTQTINRFVSNQWVSTSLSKESETEMVNEKVNCWNYVIIDSLAQEKTKKDDVYKANQKKFDKKIRKDLKRTIKHSAEILTVDSSTHSIQRSDWNESASLQDTFWSSSLHSSRRPKGTRSMMETSQDKSYTMDKKSSPNSSFIKNSTNSDGQTHRHMPAIDVSSQKVHYAMNEELPKTWANPMKYVERLLSQNKFHFRQIAYKDYPINKEAFKKQKQNKPDDLLSFNPNEQSNQDDLPYQKEIELVTDNTDIPGLRKLFTFNVDGLWKEKNISSKYICHAMDWNSQNEDLLAAVYGEPDINSKEPGFLCFWTLKNPLHPERVIRTPRGLTYCNFSKRNPYLIVVSDYQGEIMIYDWRNLNDKPIADSLEVKDKHTDIVWECKWIERPNDKNEIIITSSSDGKMKEWSLKKGLEVTDWLKMKKSTSFPKMSWNPFAKYLKSDRGDGKNKDIKETLIFREANGLSFDFPKNDTTIYYVALEECTIHRCRISYKDQYTDNYYGHQGPVNKIRCNPFDPNILISCSYDWTIKIWNCKHNYPVMNLHTNELIHQVNDIEWSSDTSTVFGCVANDGRIEIWDLARRAIQPLIILSDDDNVPKKSIKFSSGGKVVATGNATGNIDVFRIYNMEHSPVSDEDQVKRLKKVIDQNSDISTKI